MFWIWYFTPRTRLTLSLKASKFSGETDVFWSLWQYEGKICTSTIKINIFSPMHAIFLCKYIDSHCFSQGVKSLWQLYPCKWSKRFLWLPSMHFGIHCESTLLHGICYYIPFYIWYSRFLMAAILPLKLLLVETSSTKWWSTHSFRQKGDSRGYIKLFLALSSKRQ
jgi:hypothetical protein